MPRLSARFAFLLAALALMLFGAARADDPRENYYYPPVTSQEIFERDIGEGPPATRLTRVAFVTEITRQQQAKPVPPRYAVYAKGARAEHMIITALDPTIFETLFRARAVLAQLTASARQTELFTKTGMSAEVTWFDLVKILGFEDIVITDGVSWSHRVIIR